MKLFRVFILTLICWILLGIGWFWLLDGLNNYHLYNYYVEREK